MRCGHEVVAPVRQTMPGYEGWWHKVCTRPKLLPHRCSHLWESTWEKCDRPAHNDGAVCDAS